MALVPRPTAAPEPEPDGDLASIRRPHWVAWIFVVLSAAAQSFVLAQLWEYRHRDPNCGESCAYAGMAMVVYLGYAAWFVLPGLVATGWLMRDALRQRRAHGGYIERLVILGGVLALTPVTVAQLLLSDQKIARGAPAPAAAAVTPSQQRKNDELEGYAWASDNGVVRANACTVGNPVFQGGCRKFAYAHGDTLPDGRPNGVVIQLKP